MELAVKTTEMKPVKYLRAMCDVRYWEDAEINGVVDENGSLIPCRNGDTWDITIDLDTGKIENWPDGTTADVHFKVCDAGAYQLQDPEGIGVADLEGYVPDMLSPGGDGYGDYVIMKIGPDGQIENWKADLSPFEEAAE